MTSNTNPFEPGSRIWAYCRDSGGEEQQDSVPSQHRAIEAYCQKSGLILNHVFTDEARPGSTTVGRDGLEDLQYLAGQQPRPVEGIIFWSYSRLARSQLDSQFIKSDLRRKGYVLHSMTDDVPFGEFAPVVEALIDWKNERYLKDLSRDVRRALWDLARAGYAPGGFPPRGYKAQQVKIGETRDGRPHVVCQWVPDPDMAPRVQQAFKMRAEGASYQQILEATHVFPIRGSYVTMFRNKTYLGTRKCGDLEVPGVHEPLIDRDTWDAVQATLRGGVKKGTRWQADKPHPRRVASPFLLSGLARCAECGAAMIGKEDFSGRHKRGYRYYMCGRKNREGSAACPTGKIQADGPENAVLRFVTENALTAEFVRQLVAELNEQASQQEPLLQIQINDTQRQLAEVDKAINVLLDLAEMFGAASAGQRLIEREAERTRLSAELRHLEGRQNAQQLTVPSETIERLLREWLDILGGDNISAKQGLLKKIVAWVELGTEQGKIAYTFPLRCADLYTIPPGGCCIKNRTMGFGSAAE